MKLGHLVFKTVPVIQEGKILKIERQTIDNTHLLQCALEFQSYHAQWRSRGASGGTRPGAHQHTLFRHLKTRFSE